MSFLTEKFKGIYRIKCPFDLDTNDFPKKLNGQYEDVDQYIECQNGNKVFYYGRSTLQAYIPSLGRGHNIIKTINPNIIYDIEETDSEILFKFKYKDYESIIPLLKPYQSCVNRSPYSNKNRPKIKYEIPENDLTQYKDIVQKIPKENILVISHKTKEFLKSLVTKRNTWENIKADMYKKGLKEKEYIYIIGKWNDYIKYLTKNIEN